MGISVPSGALFLICLKLIDQTVGTSCVELLQEWKNKNKSVFVFLCFCNPDQLQVTEENFLPGWRIR